MSKEIHIVAPGDDGIRLDRWFKRHRPEVPHALLEKALRKGQVRVGGAKAVAGLRVETGQEIAISVSLDAVEQARPVRAKPEAPANPALVEKLRGMILYEDDRLLILNKPPGLAVQGGSGQKEHLDGLLPYLREGAELKLVHRLDKDTSGVLVLAKGANSAARLAKAFSGKTAEKTYLALVAGVPSPRQGKIDLPLAKEDKGRHSGMATLNFELQKAARDGLLSEAEVKAAGGYEKVGVSEEKGQRAVTLYRVVDTVGKHLSWVELQPVTGRTHQLRVHMAEIGCPIIGDGKYGGAGAFMRELGLPEMLHLHAARIVLPGEGGRGIDVRAPLPVHMQHSKRLLGLE